MKPRLLIDSADIPGGGQLRLFERGGDFSIMLGANELMNSRLSGSEQALATLTCARLATGALPSLLIGGLGMGFTLRAALAALPATARVTVVELVPEVVAWARGPMAAVHGGSLSDPRVAIVEADAVDVIAGADAAYDAILLDVDNGPDGLTRAENDRLYDPAGLQRIGRALRPGGILSVWSSGADAGFTRRLRQAGFDVEEVPVRATGRSGARHHIWLARLP